MQAAIRTSPAPRRLTPPPLSRCCLQVGAHLGLKPVQRSGLVATMDGFAVLSSSKTEVLRDGDTLLVSQGRKRGTAAAFAAAADEGLPPAKKRGAGASSSGSEGEEEEKDEAGGTSSSEPSSSSSSDDEAGDTSSESASSSSSEDDEDSASSSSDSEDGKGAGKAAAGTKSPGFQTPADKATPGTAVRCHTMHCVCAAAAHRPVQQAQRSAMAQASVFLLFITPHHFRARSRAGAPGARQPSGGCGAWAFFPRATASQQRQQRQPRLQARMVR